MFVLLVVFSYLYVDNHIKKVRLMGELIILFLVFWVIGKLLKGVFGGFSRSSFTDDK